MTEETFFIALAVFATSGLPTRRDIEQAELRRSIQADLHHRQMLDAISQTQSANDAACSGLRPSPRSFADAYLNLGPDLTDQHRGMVLCVIHEELEYLRRANDRKVEDYGV